MQRLYAMLPFIVLLSCFGCADVRREAKPIKSGEGYNRTTKVERIEFDGHTYIVFREVVYQGVGVSAVHDPDCECKSR